MLLEGDFGLQDSNLFLFIHLRGERLESNIIHLKFKETEEKQTINEHTPSFLFDCIEAFESAGFVVKLVKYANDNRNQTEPW